MITEHVSYDLHHFGLKDMIHAGRVLRTLDRSHTSMEDAARSVVDLFHDSFHCAAGKPNCILARCFKTHAFGRLPPALQHKLAPVPPASAHPPETQFLTLLASRGEHPKWNSRHTSGAHHAIPLATVAMLAQAPMIHQLVLQLGLDPKHVVHPSAQTDVRHQTFNVFHVEHAPGSPMVPDQQGFVERHGVASVLGFGGLLPAGELFAVILFTRVHVAAETASLFRTLALGVKLRLLPFSGKQVFADDRAAN